MKNSSTFPELRVPHRPSRLWRPGPYSIARKTALVLCLAAASAGSAQGMDPHRAMSQYVRERWGPAQGFPRGPVYAISQSADGYLWIGTQSGLVRFDGVAFHVLRDVPGLQNGEDVPTLMADKEGNLWIGAASRLLRYRNGAFDSPAGGLPSRITTMRQTSQGDLLLSVMERGVMVYRQGKLQQLADANNMPRSPVLAIAQTSDGSIWSGTRGAGLFHFHQGKTESVSDGLPDLKVNCLLADDQGSLWAGTDSGMARWNGTRLESVGPASLGAVQVLALERDRDGNIWAGTDSLGLLRFNDRGVSYLDPGDEKSRLAVTALFEDREGNLWIGSANGIERLRDSAFVTYSQPEGLPTDGSNPVFVDADNRMWFPPVDGGLWWVKDGRHGHVSNDGLDRDVVYSISGRKGELWLGRQHGGLTRLLTQGGTFESHTYTKADGLAQNSVFSVYLASDGSVWAGTLSGGVSRLRGGRFVTYTSADGLLSNTVDSILEAADGSMWFATPRGLNSLSKEGRWQSFTSRNGLPSDNAYCLLEDSGGMLWVGTAAGLAFRREGSMQTPPEEPAELKEPILGIAEDRQGAFWIATSNRVMRVNREALLQGRLRDGDVHEYGTSDGLRGLEGVRRHRSVVTDSQGRVWFSLNRGISMVDPARLKRDAAPAIPHVLTISADGNAVPIERPVRIPGGHQRLTFTFVGLSLSAPERVRFRYRLDGYDTRWNDAGSGREAGYTNLSPRQYRFRVVARNPDGAWNKSEDAVVFAVEPLYWQSWWFQAGVAAALAGGILALYRYRMRQMTNRLNLRFEERLAERTRIAQILHDTLLQGFLSASMQVHVATDSLPEDARAKPILTRALQLMRQVIDEGRNAVRGLRSSSSVSLDLEQAFALVCEQTPACSENADCAFRVRVEGEARPLHPMLRDDVYRIGREALMNAFHHARAKRVEVEINYSTRRLRLVVRDDGCGIDPGALKTARDGHWGLSGMRELAEQIGARFRVYSGPTAGTVVELRVPGHIAFQGQDTHRPKWFGSSRLVTARTHQEPAIKG